MSVEEEKVDRPNYIVLEEALTLMKRAYDLMKQEAVDVRKEKEAFDSVAKKLEHVHFTSTIKLNVGGQSFTTSLQTLTKDKGSMLHAMFSGRFDTKPAEDGSYFIDRDGTHFRYILNYLRTGELVVPENKIVRVVIVRKELLSEAEFYQIRGIVDELCPSPFLDSKILSEEQKQIFVNTWLKERLNRRHSTFVLLYRASRDGWRSLDFHSHCDYRGPTVTVVKSGDYIFGGFTEKSWDDSSGYKHCAEAFLFSLVNPSGEEPTKFPLKAGSGKSAMYCDSGGPAFGVGHDLFISSEANANSDSSSKYLNRSYACPSHLTFNSTFLTGNEFFTVDELEVFVYQQ